MEEAAKEVVRATEVVLVEAKQVEDSMVWAAAVGWTVKEAE